MFANTPTAALPLDVPETNVVSKYHLSMNHAPEFTKREIELIQRTEAPIFIRYVPRGEPAFFHPASTLGNQRST